MGCCNNPNYQDRAARESINRSTYEACQCADRSCECKDLAEQYAQNAEDTWNDFQTRYLGAYSIAPVTSTTGALYFNTVSNQMFVWNGTTWTAVPAATIIGDGDKGDITVSGLGSTWTIDNGAVTSAKIANGTIVNGDISNTAAIAGTKISPNFGAQVISSTESVSLNGAVLSQHSFGSISQNLASPQLNLSNNFNGNGNHCPFIVLSKQRGVNPVQSGDRIGSITFLGYDGANLSPVAEISASASGPVSAGIVPGEVNLSTATTTGSLTQKLNIKNNGDVGIGITSPSSKLHVAGDLTVSSATTANTATAGAETLPANPVGFLVVSINGTSRKIPYYAT